MASGDPALRELIAARLRGSSPQDPTDARAPGPGDVPAALRKLRPKRLVPAAVLVAVVEHEDHLDVLLTQRTAHLTHHAGQISFPGGRIEPGDDGPLGAALRETREEVGLDPGRIEVAGYLQNYLTITGYSVTPVIGFVRGPLELQLDPNEVEEAFAVPLRYVLDPANHHRHSHQLYGHEVGYYEIPWETRRIWGATAGMIVGLYKLLYKT